MRHQQHECVLSMPVGICLGFFAQVEKKKQDGYLHMQVYRCRCTGENQCLRRVILMSDLKSYKTFPFLGRRINLSFVSSLASFATSKCTIKAPEVRTQIWGVVLEAQLIIINEEWLKVFFSSKSAAGKMSWWTFLHW